MENINLSAIFHFSTFFTLLYMIGKGGKGEKTKTKGANSKNMFSVACHEGKIQYLRSL